MVLEIAQIEVAPGKEEAFEDGVAKAAPVFRRAKGCHGMTLQRSLEKPTRYRLFVRWETLENHTVDFRGSADFQEWRKLVGHCFASPPEVEHVREAVHGFRRAAYRLAPAERVCGSGRKARTGATVGALHGHSR
jgi:quinol monooxygenase YgiN